VAACNRVGLGHLSSQLDRNANWDNELAGDELQRLAFARLLLHRPGWICVNEAVDSLDESDRKEILTIFDKELAGATVISLGRRDLRDGFSTRVVHLVKVPEGPRLTPHIYSDSPAQTTKPAVSAI
jgi:vitamin B12/bleomycin/antimicrobial peptide transport system ATP-binding/permease protein